MAAAQEGTASSPSTTPANPKAEEGTSLAPKEAPNPTDNKAKPLSQSPVHIGQEPMVFQVNYSAQNSIHHSIGLVDYSPSTPAQAWSELTAPKNRRGLYVRTQTPLALVPLR